MYDDAIISGDAAVFDDARVFDTAQVYNNARVFGKARVYDNRCIENYQQYYGEVHPNQFHSGWFDPHHDE